jgi:2EXR family/SAP domain
MVFDRVSHGWRETPDLRDECKHRGLDHHGTKYDLICRLSQADVDSRTPEGKILDYERRLKAHQEKRPADIVPFRKFKSLPPELRDLVWEYSLPGPRTLCPGTRIWGETAEGWAEDTTVLYFPKDQHTPNPSALSVCRESRKIALQRYRLCFGTPNVYADLTRDILFFWPLVYF